MERYVLRINDTINSTWGIVTAGGLFSMGKTSWFLEEHTFATKVEANAHIKWCLASGWYRPDITTDNFEVIPVKQYPELHAGSFYLTEEEAKYLREEVNKENATEYNLEYKGVLCTHADWDAKPYKFYLVYNGKEYVYTQKRYISQSADTDHIRCVIEQFLEDILSGKF